MTPNNCVVVGQTFANASGNLGNIWADKIVKASFQIAATGTINGSFQVQVSNDQAYGVAAGQFVPTNWSNLTGGALSLTAAGAYMIPAFDCSYEYMRIVFTDASNGASTGSYSVRLKSIGF